MKKFKSVDELVSQLQPDKPVYCIRKKSIQIASKFFQDEFPGKILYAVKTNPNKEVLKTIIKSGIKHFDVASIEEIKTIKQRLVDQIDNSVMFYDQILNIENIAKPEKWYHIGPGNVTAGMVKKSISSKSVKVVNSLDSLNDI